MHEKPEQPEEPGKSKKPQQQQTISLRISDVLLTRLERFKQLISSKTGEKVSTSDAAKQLLESTREDRLDAAHGPGTRGVDAEDSGVSHRAADDLHVEHPGQLEIGDESARALEQPRVLPAGDSAADEARHGARTRPVAAHGDKLRRPARKRVCARSHKVCAVGHRAPRPSERG